MYSASVVDFATTGCRLLLQLTRFRPMKTVWPLVYIPSIVCIRENLETCSIGTRTIAKHKVLRRSQVLEDMLHLLPMSLAWIRIKATQSSHCKGDVRTCTNR